MNHRVLAAAYAFNALTVERINEAYGIPANLLGSPPNPEAEAEAATRRFCDCSKCRLRRSLGMAAKPLDRIAGHPDLAPGARVRVGATQFISIPEAISRESNGEEVEVNIVPLAEDTAALALARARYVQRWANDGMPDGWTDSWTRRPNREGQEGPINATP